jgi:hypothetical protein
MVYAFGVGLLIGLPVGCYMRERGYTQKIMKAYEIMTGVKTDKKMDQF